MIKTTNQAATRLRTAALEQQHCFALHPRCQGPTSHHHFKLKIQVKIVIPSFLRVLSVSLTHKVSSTSRPNPATLPSASKQPQKHQHSATPPSRVCLGLCIAWKVASTPLPPTVYGLYSLCISSPLPPLSCLTNDVVHTMLPSPRLPNSHSISISCPFLHFVCFLCRVHVAAGAVGWASRGLSTVKTRPWTSLTTETLAEHLGALCAKPRPSPSSPLFFLSAARRIVCAAQTHTFHV